MENITAIIILDKRKAKTTGKYPVKLRVTYRRQQKYYPTYIDLTQDEYDSVFSIRPRKEFKTLRDTLDAIKGKATAIITALPDFTFNGFEEKMLKPISKPNDVYAAFDDYIHKLTKEGRINSAKNYRCCAISLKKYKSRLSFNEVTQDFLYKYEAYMITKGVGYTTIGIYLRTLRSIFNMAIDKDIISSNAYPFGKRKYQIPIGKNIKKALPLNDILRIKNYPVDPTNPLEEMARDFWIFSYLANGMNFKDIALLKFNNLTNDTILFERAKTKQNNRSNPKIVRVHLLPDLKNIIQKYRNKESNKDNYVFPILRPGLSPLEEHKLINKFVMNTNKYMKGMAHILNIDLPLTTYYARHSYATVLRNSGASVEYISESLGHTSVSTTANYLDSFEDDTRKKIASLLLGGQPEKKSRKKERV